MIGIENIGIWLPEDFESNYDLKEKLWGYKCCHATTKHAYCIPIQPIQNNNNMKRKVPPS